MKSKLILGDSQEVLPKLIEEGIRVDLTVTSPPYDNLRNYNNSLEWNFDIFKSIANELYGITKDGGVVVWVVNDSTKNGSKSCTSFKQALHFKQIGFNLHDVMIFAKKNPVPQIYHKRYTDAFEYMFVFSKGKPKTHNPLKEPCKTSGEISKTFKSISDNEQHRYINKGTRTKEFKIKPNIWYYGLGGTNFGHPAMFPLQLAKDHILSWSNPNDTVLDCFMGSGTVGVACLQTNRNFIGIEKVEEYYDTAKQRINEANEQRRLI